MKRALLAGMKRVSIVCVVAQGDLGVLLPDPGVTVGAELHGVDGSSTRIAVTRALDGTVSIASLATGFTTSAVPSGCSNRFSIESTATHEIGHVPLDGPVLGLRTLY